MLHRTTRNAEEEPYYKGQETGTVAGFIKPWFDLAGRRSRIGVGCISRRRRRIAILAVGSTHVRVGLAVVVVRAAGASMHFFAFLFRTIA